MHSGIAVFLSLKIFEYLLWLLPKQLYCFVVYGKSNQAFKYPTLKKFIFRISKAIRLTLKNCQNFKIRARRQILLLILSEFAASDIK